MIWLFFAFLKKEYEAKRPLLGNKEDSNLKVIDFKLKKICFSFNTWVRKSYQRQILDLTKLKPENICPIHQTRLDCQRVYQNRT